MLGKLLASLLSGTIAIYLGILFMKLYNEFQEKKHRKEQLYFAKKRLHKLVLRFRDDCMEETKKFVAIYTAKLSWKSYRYATDYMTCSFISDYRKSISSIKEDYLVHYAIRYSEGDNRLRCEAEDLPRYILDEYESELSEIATIFQNLSDSMWQQIEELKENK